MFVISVINSIVGKPGNIGFRFSYVQDNIIKSDIENVTLARGSISNQKNTFTLGLLAYFPRALHYLRRNYFPKLNTRKIDIQLFEMFFLIYLPLIIYKSNKHKKKVAYVVELSPFIIKILKKNGFKIILDIPIAPNNYVRKVIEDIGNHELTYHADLDFRERECCDLADQILVPSSFVLDEILDLGCKKEKIKIIPFGTRQTPQFHRSDDKNGIDFVFAGNVSNRKGINFLLEAWDNSQFENDRLHLCGRVNRNIKEKINSINSRNNIILPGFVDTSEYFNHCDIYIFPSLMEGSSKSVYEAMNAGLACIVTHQSGSVIEDGKDGFIINAFSASEINEALLKIKSTDFIAMGKQAKTKSAFFTWDRYSERVLAEIQND